MGISSRRISPAEVPEYNVLNDTVVDVEKAGNNLEGYEPANIKFENEICNASKDNETTYQCTLQINKKIKRITLNSPSLQRFAQTDMVVARSELYRAVFELEACKPSIKMKNKVQRNSSS